MYLLYASKEVLILRINFVIVIQNNTNVFKRTLWKTREITKKIYITHTNYDNQKVVETIINM